MRLSTGNSAVCLGLMLIAVTSLQAQPTDNPVSTRYADKAPAWTDELKWQTVVNINDFPGDGPDEKLNAAQQALDQKGGGVVFFPAGTYHFKDTIHIHPNVILRGETPATVKNAHSDQYQLASKLRFPEYKPTFSGEGTPNDTAFKSIQLQDAGNASNVAVVHLDIDRAFIYYGGKDGKIGKNRLVFGNIMTNTATVSHDVPMKKIGQHPWQRWIDRHRAAIHTHSMENLLIANNRIPKSGDGNFVMKGYILATKAENVHDIAFNPRYHKFTTVTADIEFDYDNRPGIYANDTQLGSGGDGLPNGTPDKFPHGFRKGVQILDNYIYATGRCPIAFSGDGTIVARNVIRIPNNIDRPTARGYETTGPGSTNDNRGIQCRGWRWQVIDNDIQVYPNKTFDKKHWICDGEGIMHENHLNAKVLDAVVKGNKINSYICLWRVEVDGLTITDNDVQLRSNGAYIGMHSGIDVRGRKRFKGQPYCPVNRLVIKDNKTNANIIVLGKKDGKDNVIENNTFTGEGKGKLVVENLPAKVADNHNFYLFQSFDDAQKNATPTRPLSSLTAEEIDQRFAETQMPAKEIFITDDKGRIIAKPTPTPASLTNPWPAEWQNKFIDRANHAIQTVSAEPANPSTVNEREKDCYPRAMNLFAAGDHKRAIEIFQMEDHEKDKYHKHTLGIDLYFCFTLKGQMRKYFLFGAQLDPAYRKRMFEAGLRWTWGDPKNTPHPVYKQYNHKQRGWGPDRFGNRQVDGRRTDNLWAMSDTSIYLMAEETGNENTRRAALKRLRHYVVTMYDMGIGEWDSENYLGHTFSAYLNLYDFAKDPEARMLAKAALDWLSTSAAVKYWRGGWAGPVKRDYGNLMVWDSLAAKAFGLYFNDCPIQPDVADRDDIYAITSSYRPPAAVVALAHKQFDKPVELLISHPTYQNWSKGGNQHPEFHETTYIAKTYQLGSLPNGSGGDVNGLKMLTYNSKRGVDYFTVGDAKKIDKKPRTRQKNFVCHMPGRTNIAQYRNLCIYLTNATDSELAFVAPPFGNTADNPIQFLRGEKTWIAIIPIHLQWQGKDDELSQRIGDVGDIYTAKTAGSTLSGFAMEVGDEQSHDSFEQFRKAVTEKAKVDLSQLETDKKATFTGSNGQTVAMQYNDKRVPFFKTDPKMSWVITGSIPTKTFYTGLPTIWRNGKLHNWKDHYAQYRNADGQTAPVHLDWNGKQLQVIAGGYTFTGTMTGNGQYRFTNTSP